MAEGIYRWRQPDGTGSPRELAAAALQLDGIEFLNQIGRGKLPVPPAGATAGIVPVEIGDGFATFQLEPAEWHYNPIGSVHGGMLATLADTALGCAVHTKLPAGTAYTSLDLTIKFTRAATLERGMLTCEGRLVTLGRRTATAEAKITDSRGSVVAHAVTTCLLTPMAE